MGERSEYNFSQIKRFFLLAPTLCDVRRYTIGIVSSHLSTWILQLFNESRIIFICNCWHQFSLLNLSFIVAFYFCIVFFSLLGLLIVSQINVSSNGSRIFLISKFIFWILISLGIISCSNLYYLTLHMLWTWCYKKRMDFFSYTFP